jgi:ppGpp synthetase/RelA/SpoT-type nucleotidyltranferase
MKFKDLDNKIQKTAENMVLQEKVIEKNDKVHSGVQPWGEILAALKGKEKSPEEVARETYRNAYQIVFETEKKLSRLLKRVAPKDSKILIDIKKEDAFVDKVVNRGKSPEKITDVIRSAILVETQDDLQKLISNLKKYADIYEYEEKIEKEDPEYGYHGSYHFLISIDNVLIEVQAMTKRLWAFKEPAHQIYSKWRSVKEFDNRIAKKDKQQSKILFKKGNKDVYALEAGERLSKYKDIVKGKYAQKIKFTN